MIPAPPHPIQRIGLRLLHDRRRRHRRQLTPTLQRRHRRIRPANDLRPMLPDTPPSNHRPLHGRNGALGRTTRRPSRRLVAHPPDPPAQRLRPGSLPPRLPLSRRHTKVHQRRSHGHDGKAAGRRVLPICGYRSYRSGPGSGHCTPHPPSGTTTPPRPPDETHRASDQRKHQVSVTPGTSNYPNTLIGTGGRSAPSPDPYPLPPGTMQARPAAADARPDLCCLPDR